jgi:hypothetical protein
MAIDRSGIVHLAYSAPADDYRAYEPVADLTLPQTIRYVTVANGQWGALETLSLLPGYFQGLSIAVDAADRVHVAFSELGSMAPDGSLSVTFQISHLVRDTSAWTREIVASAGKALLARGSLAVTADGDTHIAYCAIGDDPPRCDGVFHGLLRGGSWSVALIERGGCTSLGRDATLAVGKDGDVHVAYRGCGSELVIATKAAL